MSRTTPARRYTQTRVSSTDTQLEIKVLIEDARDLGLSEPAWQTVGDVAVLRFLVEGRPCQVVLQPPPVGGDPATELRRLHRVLLHFLKNAIEAVRSGLFTVGEALMASHMTADGKMLGKAIFSAGDAGRPVTLALPEPLPPAPTRALPAGPARALKR